MKAISAFNWIDLAVLVCFLRIGYIAANKGFILEFFKDIGIIASLFFSFQFYPALNKFLLRILWLKAKPDLSLFLSFFLIAAGVYIVVRYVRGIVLALFKIESHYLIERWVSFFLGALRAAVFVSLVFFSFWLMNVPYLNKSMKKAASTNVFLPLAPRIYKSTYGLYIKFFPSAPFNSQAAKFAQGRERTKAGKKGRQRKSSRR